MIDFSAVPFLDSTAAATIDGFAHKARRHGTTVYLAGACPPIRRVLMNHGVRPPQVRFKTSLVDALADARTKMAAPEGEGVPAGAE